MKVQNWASSRANRKLWHTHTQHHPTSCWYYCCGRYRNTKKCIMLNYSTSPGSLLTSQLHRLWWSFYFFFPQIVFCWARKWWIFLFFWSYSDIVGSFLLVISLEARGKQTRGMHTVLTAQGSNLSEECTQQLCWYFLLQTKRERNVQNPAGESRGSAIPRGHPPSRNLELTVHVDVTLNLYLLIILSLSINMLIFTHFCPH